MNLSENPCEVLLIAGRSGVGKSTVSWEVTSRLADLGVAHAFIEGDFLDQVHPAPEDDPARTRITARNLAAVWGNYRELGQRRLIYCNTVSVLEPDMITEAMGGDVTPVGVLLTADDAAAEERLRAREIGSYLEPHLPRSKRMARRLETHAPAWVHRVPTGGRTVPDIAAAVIALTGWTD
ncbi:AAA family ATPase [Glycomyces sp. A-F 0318]|uniref:AAA family ATPase n=1 Tax=Glycomyces amatae TaxID=2881355 RepID=UPI001E29B4B2|nr:AAA family ATPase [Glycomyces amatae]MCD0442956.1 AAA family ATPase [Glycomyces amatae]